MAHLVVDISGHGFGHAGQVLPVVRALLARDPGLRVTLRAAVPAAKLREHLGAEVPVEAPPPDVGMVMRGPLEVDATASAKAYAALHADFAATLARETERLAALAPDLVLADVPYVSLAAAQRLGVANVALCSLNWAQIYASYCGDRPEAERILDQIRTAYRSADAFLQPRPHAAMPDLTNARSIGPICRVGRRAPAALRHTLGLAAGTRVALAAFGGIPGRRGLGPPPQREGLVWLVPGGLPGRADAADADALGWPFCDLAASTDLVLTKVGYGTVCETVAAGTRLLLVARPDWPEDAAMRAWVGGQAETATIDRRQLASGDYGAALDRLLARPRGVACPPTGIEEAVDLLAPHLDRAGGSDGV